MPKLSFPSSISPPIIKLTVPLIFTSDFVVETKIPANVSLYGENDPVNVSLFTDTFKATLVVNFNYETTT